MRIFKTTVLAAALLLLAGSVLLDAQQKGDGQSEKPAPLPAKQIWSKQDVIRNGTFEFGNSGWAMKGGFDRVDANSGKAGDGKDLGAGIEVNSVFSTIGFIAQALHLPEKLHKIHVRADWRVVSKGTAPALQSFAAALGSYDANGNFESAASLASYDANTLPGTDWQQIDRELTTDELKALAAMQAAKRRSLFIASVNGEAIQMDVDNVCVIVDGESNVPRFPGQLAWAETSAVADAKGPRQVIEIVTARPNGVEREVKFRGEDAFCACYGLAWRPDGEELCFSSTHEMAYSYFTANLFALDKSGVRRLTNPPGRSELLKDARKTGKVKLAVRNLLSEDVQGVIYIEGARKPGVFSLGPANSGRDKDTLEIDEVVDFGDAVLQTVIVRVGGKSALTGVLLDVKAGETVTAGGTATVDNSLVDINAASPCYSRDGGKIVFSSMGFFTVEAKGGVPQAVYGGILGSRPALSPKDDALVYAGIDGGLWLLKTGAEKAEAIIKGDATSFADDPVWLPDASGVVCTARTTNAAGWSGRNLWAWGASTGQVVQLTDMLNEEIQNPTVSHDGQFVAAIRLLGSNGKYRRELWVWSLKNPAACWQVPTTGEPSHPAWRPVK